MNKLISQRSRVYYHRHHNKKFYSQDVKSSIMTKIRTLVKHGFNPSIQVSSFNKRYDVYYTNKIELTNEELIVEKTYQELISCAYDYPDRNIHLIGYSTDNEIVYDKLLN